MFAKCVAILALMTVIAAGLLIQRQQRYESMSEMVRLQRHMVETRHAVWEWEARIANHGRLPALQSASDRQALALESITPKPDLNRPAEALAINRSRSSRGRHGSH